MTQGTDANEVNQNIWMDVSVAPLSFSLEQWGNLLSAAATSTAGLGITENGLAIVLSW
jgi:hypothetical protein